MCRRPATCCPLSRTLHVVARLLCPGDVPCAAFSPISTTSSPVFTNSRFCLILVHTPCISVPTSSEQDATVVSFRCVTEAERGGCSTGGLVSPRGGPGPWSAEKCGGKGPRGSRKCSHRFRSLASWELACLLEGGSLTWVLGAWIGSQKALPSPQLAVHLFRDLKPF